MATIKSYTDIKQSRKLAGILPLESADYCWGIDYESRYLNFNSLPYPRPYTYYNDEDNIPCWSLAALFDVLPKIYYPVKDHPTYIILGKPKDKWCALYWDVTGMQDGEETLADNPIDACYEMILKLHELKML